MLNKETIKKTIKYIGKYKGFILISIILSFASVLLSLYVPILIGQAIDYIVGENNVNFSKVSFYIVQALIITGIGALLQWIFGMINNRVTYGVVKDIRETAFNKIQDLPLKYLDTHPTGETVSRIIADTDQFADGLLMGFTQFFTGIVTIIATLVFMIYLNWQVALAVVVLTPLSLVIANFIAKRTYGMFKKQSETRGEQTAYIDEIIGGLKVVKAFSYNDRAVSEFSAINDRLEKHSLKAIFFSSLTNPTTRFVNSVVYAFVAFLGSLLVPGSLTVGGLTIFLSYANQYTKPFNEISGVVAEMQNALACAQRVFDLIEEEPQKHETPVNLENVSGDIKIKNASFCYDSKKPLIQNLSLDIKKGMRVAIVGPTGCGKTTLINLLMRFYDVNEGDILIDNKSIYEITRSSLRESFGMVLQETWLYSGTIEENIKFGKDDATEEEIIAAAKAAHAHSFIKRLPKGYQTVIGEDGGSLSQGQKQLLCIARLMLKSPPMLILDEATSSIDTRTEQKIQDAFSKLLKGRTSFIVAHRLSTIKTADLILVMKDGNVIEQGTHNELINKGGFYKELYNSQFDIE
ncbi:MAG: ABC transporter ATP-binding protein [Clostridiales bacterium]|nr:ABC transporter ATP-binding protein [Clostridiales bacterium]